MDMEKFRNYRPTKLLTDILLMGRSMESEQRNFKLQASASMEIGKTARGMELVVYIKINECFSWDILRTMIKRDLRIAHQGLKDSTMGCSLKVNAMALVV